MRISMMMVCGLLLAACSGGRSEPGGSLFDPLCMPDGSVVFYEYANKAGQYGPGKCSTACTISPYCGDGRIQNGEECDGTSGCSSECKVAIPK